MRNHAKTNWKAIRIALFTMVGYFAAACGGCFLTAIIECGGYRDGILGIALALLVIAVSQWSIHIEKGE